MKYMFSRRSKWRPKNLLLRVSSITIFQTQLLVSTKANQTMTTVNINSFSLLQLSLFKVWSWALFFSDSWVSHTSRFSLAIRVHPSFIQNYLSLLFLLKSVTMFVFDAFQYETVGHFDPKKTTLHEGSLNKFMQEKIKADLCSVVCCS